MSSTKSINRDHAKKKNRPQQDNVAIASRLENILIPAIAAQKSYYRQLELRDKILNLPLMVAAVLPFEQIYARNDLSGNVSFFCSL